MSGVKKVRCRVCKTPVSQKNYRVHLKRKHEDEDPNDLREFGQQRMFGEILSMIRRMLWK